MQTLQPIDKLDVRQKPALQLRVLNHWDNLDGSIERGYAGRSLWDWRALPEKVDPRLRDYARANASTWLALSDGTLFANNSEGRCIVYRDFLPRNAIYDNDGANAVNSTDQNGHGTHVISTIADNRAAQMAAGATASPVGIAPKVNLVIARALDREGGGTYSRVIDAIQWILDNRTKYNIRVLNLSLYTPVGGPYWYDPLNQAVMRAWQAGITIVAAAGNSGPAAATIAGAFALAERKPCLCDVIARHHPHTRTRHSG